MARYAADPESARIVVPLDGLTILYHRPSRTTHVLDSPAPELLAALAEGPADAPALLARLARTHAIDVGGDASADAAITARLDELAAAGLVARVTGDA